MNDSVSGGSLAGPGSDPGRGGVSDQRPERGTGGGSNGAAGDDQIPGSENARPLLAAVAVVVALALTSLVVVLGLRDDDGNTRGATVPTTRPPTASSDAASAAQSASVSSSSPREPIDEHDDSNPYESPTPSYTGPTFSGTDGMSVPDGWQETAEGFGRALVNTQGGQDAWFKRLEPFLSPEKAAQYRKVPVDSITPDELISAKGSVINRVTVDATLTYASGLIVDVALAHNGEKWQVVAVVDQPQDE